MKKGPLAEAQWVATMQEHGFPWAERRVMGGANDRGDVAGVPGVCVEIKNHAQMQLAAWIDEAERERRGTEIAAVVHKRRGKGDPLDWYVTMTGRDFLALLAEYTRET